MPMYQGTLPSHAVGNFVVRRTYTFIDSKFNEVSMLAADWFGAAWNLDADNVAAAVARGVLKRVTARLMSGTSVLFAKDISGSDNYNTMDVASPIIELDYRNEWPREPGRASSLFMLASAGAEVVEFEIWFDIEAED